MISATLALAALLPILPVFADPVPSEPAPGSVFNEGSTCHISWEADPDSSWKVMNIQLMTGDNFNMVHLTSESSLSLLYEKFAFPDTVYSSRRYCRWHRPSKQLLRLSVSRGQSTP